MKTLALLFLLVLPLTAMPEKPEKNVVYVEEFAPKGIKLKVEKPGWVYATPKGGRKRGSLLTGIEVELVSITDKAYFVRGKKAGGIGVSGWVVPAAFSSKDPDFIKKLKKVHARQLVVRDLIAKKQVAIGMTGAEVSQVLGKPTKTTARRNAKGQTQVWEFIEYEKIKHYTNYQDPVTGGIYRRFSHTTREEKSKTVIELENGYVTATEVTEDNGPGKPAVVNHPIIFVW